ncbi:MAG: LysR substrate-binding domain-containing protein [Promicromonosporaceae bacterium]|nr:LysR substrate-binding domain-containing protein [Promicromonosporaceae bacterium]
MATVLNWGFVPGTNPDKWAARFRERVPDVELNLLPLPDSEIPAAWDSQTIDVALMRLPVDRTIFHAIPLYREDAVVVVAKEDLLAAADPPVSLAECTMTDAGTMTNAGTTTNATPLIQPADALVHLDNGASGQQIPETPNPPATIAEAFAWVAAGLGRTITSAPIARLHRRKDVVALQLADLPGPEVGLVWSKDTDNPAIEELAGIVRGRTAHSTRGSAPTPASHKATNKTSAPKTAAGKGTQGAGKSSQKSQPGHKKAGPRQRRHR